MEPNLVWFQDRHMKRQLILAKGVASLAMKRDACNILSRMSVKRWQHASATAWPAQISCLRNCAYCAHYAEQVAEAAHLFTRETESTDRPA